MVSSAKMSYTTEVKRKLGVDCDQPSPLKAPSEEGRNGYFSAGKG